MAVVFDNVGPSSAGAGGTGPPTSPVTWTHVMTPTAMPIILVGIAVGIKSSAGSAHTPGNEDGDFVITAVTANGIALTLVPGSLVHNSGTTGKVQWYYLLNPPSGSLSMSISFTNANAWSEDAIECGSVSFNGVDQTSPFKSVVTNSGSGTAASVSAPSDVSNMVAGLCGAGSDLSAPTGGTGRWLENINTNTSGGNGAVQTAPGAGGLTLGYTITPSDGWGFSAVELLAGVTGGVVCGDDDGDSFQFTQAAV